MWNGNLALSAGTAIAVQGSTDTLIVGAPGQVQSSISGAQTLLKYGLGTLELGGSVRGASDRLLRSVRVVDERRRERS